MVKTEVALLYVGSDRRVGKRLVAEFDRPVSIAGESDLETAVSHLQRNRIDCVACEISLPDGDGVDLLETLRLSYPDLPFVLVGDEIDERVATDAIEAGVTEYVERDDDRPRLAVAADGIESAIERYRATAAGTTDLLAIAETFAELPVTVAVCDRTGTFRRIGGGGLAELPGLDADAVGEGVRDVLEAHPDLRSACTRALEGEPVEYLFESGNRVFETVHSPIRSDGDQVGAAMVAVDVTDYVENERVLEKVFENARDAILILDPDNDAIRRANPAACDLLEYRENDLLETSPEAIHPDEVDLFQEFVDSVIEEGSGWTEELSCRTEGGRAVPAEISASAIEIDGRPHLLAIVRDVTDRKLYQHRLAALNEMSRDLASVEDPERIAETVVTVAERILDHPLTVFWTYQKVDDCLVPLAATKSASGLSDDETPEGRVPPIPPDTFEMDVFREGSLVEVTDYSALENAAHPETPLGTVLMVPVGEYGMLHVGSRAVEEFGDSERNLIEILTRHAEASLDRAEHTRELERQNERLDEFASVVSHDLRNPLEIAQGYLGPARETGREDYFEEVEDALEHMEALVGDVLTLARGGEKVEDPEPTAFQEVVEHAWGMVASGEADLRIEDGLGTVACDPDRIGRLFQNLFANAVDHGGSGVTVTVGPMPSGFYVADDGPGIEPADRERVFDSGETSDPDGTGFGLAIVRRIAEAHGWTVEATESASGGARFEVTGVDRRATGDERYQSR